MLKWRLYGMKSNVADWSLTCLSGRPIEGKPPVYCTEIDLVCSNSLTAEKFVYLAMSFVEPKVGFSSPLNTLLYCIW